MKLKQISPNCFLLLMLINAPSFFFNNSMLTLRLSMWSKCDSSPVLRNSAMPSGLRGFSSFAIILPKLPLSLGGLAWRARTITHSLVAESASNDSVTSFSSLVMSFVICLSMSLMRSMFSFVPLSSIWIVTVRYNGITSSLKKKSHKFSSFKIGR